VSGAATPNFEFTAFLFLTFIKADCNFYPGNHLTVLLFCILQALKRGDQLSNSRIKKWCTVQQLIAQVMMVSQLV
jgi:hypothetical protein